MTRLILTGLLIGLTVACAGCSFFGESPESELRKMVQTLEKKAVNQPELLGAVYTLRNELDCVHKKKFADNLKRDLETKGPEGRKRYNEQIKAALGDESYAALQRIREAAGYAAMFQD